MKKFVIQAKLDGKVFAFSSREDKFALTEVGEDGQFKQALAWDTMEEAKAWFKKFAEMLSNEDLKNILSMKPKIVQCTVMQ